MSRKLLYKTFKQQPLGNRDVPEVHFQVEVFPVNLCSTWSTVIILALMHLGIYMCRSGSFLEFGVGVISLATMP